MNMDIVIAVIGVFSSILTISLSYYFSHKIQVNNYWRKRKLDHYNHLILSISDLAVDGKNKVLANEEFSKYANTICLVANQSVINTLMKFHDYVKWSNQNQTKDGHDKLLIDLLLEIRKDIGVSRKDNISNFNYHLIGSSKKIN